MKIVYNLNKSRNVEPGDIIRMGFQYGERIFMVANDSISLEQHLVLLNLQTGNIVRDQDIIKRFFNMDFKLIIKNEDSVLSRESDIKGGLKQK